MTRPDSYIRKDRVKLEDKPLCLPERVRAHRWVEMEDGEPRASDGYFPWQCVYCQKLKYHARSLSDYERYATVILRDPRPAPASNGIYRLGASWDE